jgi:hypothetical protein
MARPFIEISGRIVITPVVPVCLGMSLGGKFPNLETYRQTPFRSGLPKQEVPVRAITVAVGLQNVSLAIVIGLISLGVFEMLTPALFYLPIASVTGFGFSDLMSRRDRQIVQA